MQTHFWRQIFASSDFVVGPEILSKHGTAPGGIPFGTEDSEATSSSSVKQLLHWEIPTTVKGDRVGDGVPAWE
jgi:hypothetical protein